MRRGQEDHGVSDVARTPGGAQGAASSRLLLHLASIFGADAAIRAAHVSQGHSAFDEARCDGVDPHTERTDFGGP